jgi:CheY-like chemotaxis protein
MNEKILIIDDEADIRTFLETLLKENGFKTAVSSDGESGFNLAKEFKPDVITLDIIMPRETGVKFYRTLLKDPELNKTPVIILSGVSRYKDLFARDHATLSKPFAFIEKPIVPEALIKCVKDAIASKPKT